MPPVAGPMSAVSPVAKLPMVLNAVDQRVSALPAIASRKIIALLLRLYSGRYPQDILDTPPDFVTALQLESHLSPTRSNGLSSMLKAIRSFATEALRAA